MKVALLVLSLCLTPAVSLEKNPLSAVIALMDGLTAKVEADGVAEDKAYTEYVQWCKDVNRNGKQDIATAKAKIEKLDAAIAEETSNSDVASSKIEDLAASIGSNEADLKAATNVRDKERADFEAAEGELVDGVDTLGRAIGVISREMAKNPAALMQLDMSSMNNLVQAVGAIIDAAGLSIADSKKLMSLAQTQESSDDEGAPAAAAYKSHSGGIVDVLEDMKEKAEGELADLRKAEGAAQHNFNTLKQSLEDELAQWNKELAAQKSAKAAAEEARATAEGELDITQKDLAESESNLETAQNTCQEVAANHQASVNSRAEELGAIAQAKKILTDTSSGAVAQTYDFVQVSMQTSADLANAEIVTSIRKLAEKYHSASLSQLASRITAAIRYGGRNSDDVFAKVKGLIRDMLEKLAAEAADEANEKAWCDEQTEKTTAKKEDLEGDIAKLTAKIDKAAARSASLKEEVKELQAELANLASAQAEADKLRGEQNADYSQAKSDLELGLSGVRKALGVLRDYYQNDASLMQGSFTAMMQQAPPPKPVVHSAAGGAGGSIINILEVVESDFATNLAKEEQAESESQSAYDKMTQENKITKSIKDQDVKYKTQEAASLDKAISDLTSDRDTAEKEHAAVTEYLGQVNARCIAKPETYEQRAGRRQAEIAGLKEALSILEGAPSFAQKNFLARLH